MDTALRRRHVCYGRLLALCVLVMISFALPRGWNRLAAIGFNLLPLVMLRGMGRPLAPIPFRPWPRTLYRLLGITAMVSSLGWYLTPLTARGTGVLMLVVWIGFVGWSTLRLVRGLGHERQVNGRVLMGACAGYLLIGLTAGLLFSALETIRSGSFSSLHGPAIAMPMPSEGVTPASVMVWQLNFVRLNYFAFVSLTTVGYGDITPVTPQAQMASVVVSVIGTIYLAVVMGLLISRTTVQVESEASRGLLPGAESWDAPEGDSRPRRSRGRPRRRLLRPRPGRR
ncbi:MAG: potassium channel family protein [Vulcanococcus sp.]